MLKLKSTHKRKRSSARADKSRSNVATASLRWIVNFLPRQPSKQDDDDDQRLETLIQSHPFNHSLQILVPLRFHNDDSNQTTIPKSGPLHDLIQQLTDLSHRDIAGAYLATVPISLFLDPIFVTAFIRTGSLVALSLGRLDAEDVFCLDGQGTLVLSLTKDTYQTLGLTGRASHFSRMASGRAGDRQSGPDTRYIVEIPLLAPSFIPGKRGYQQALERLGAWDVARANAQNTTTTVQESHLVGSIPNHPTQQVGRDHATWKVLFNWTPTKHAIDTVRCQTKGKETISTTIHFPTHLVDPATVVALGIDHNLSRPTIETDVWTPLQPESTHLSDSTIHWGDGRVGINQLVHGWSEPSSSSSCNDSRIDWETWYHLAQDLVEWANLTTLSSDLVKTYYRPDDLSLYSVPTPHIAANLVRLTWKGFLSSQLISSICHTVDQFIRTSQLLPPPPPSLIKSKRHPSSLGYAIISTNGFQDSPISWKSTISLSDRLVSTNSQSLQKKKKESQSQSESSDDSDSDSEETQNTQSKKQKKPNKSGRGRGKIQKNQTERGCIATSNINEDGWVGIVFGQPHVKTQTNNHDASWVLIEMVSKDTRS